MTQRSTAFSAIMYIWSSVAAVLACFALLYLAQYAQLGVPFERLPLSIIVMLGLLFSGMLYPCVTRISSSSLAFNLTLGRALVLSGAVAFVFSRVSVNSPHAEVASITGSWQYIFAPIVAMAVAHGFAYIFKDKAQLFIAMLVYVMCTVLANFTLDSFIPVPITLPEWMPTSFEGLINVGTLFFGITFTQRDRIHRYGRNWAYITIAIAAVANVLAALYLHTPPRYIIVSFLAILVSESADTEVYQRLLARSWLTRVISSNAVSAPLDTIIFAVLAFYGEPFATATWLTNVILTDIVVKFLVALVAALGFRPRPLQNPQENSQATTVP